MSARNFYNQCINLFWTGLCFLPVLSFWIGHGADIWLFVFLGTSIVVMFLPEHLIKSLQFSTQRQFYEKMGVKIIRRFVQDGDWRFNRHASINASRIKGSGGLQAYLTTIAMYERYHWGCFLFFTETSLYGKSDDGILWLIATFAANVIYNVCPLLLQQYNRIRITSLLSHRRGRSPLA